MKYWRIRPTIFSMFLSAITCTFVLYAALHDIGLSTYYGGINYYSGGSDLDVPLACTTALACLILITSFKQGRPQRMYKGLQVYTWLLGIVFCYLASVSGRIPVAGIPLLPVFNDPLVLLCLLATLIVSLQLLLFRAPLLRLLTLLSSTEKKPVATRERPHFSYQAGYQPHYSGSYEQPTPGRRISGSFALYNYPYDSFEQPQTSYPPAEMEM